MQITHCNCMHRASFLLPSFALNVLSTDGGWWQRVGGWSLALSKNALQPLYFLQFVALCPECAKPFGSLWRTSLGFCRGFSSMAFNNWLLLACFFFFWSILVHVATFISKRANTADKMKWWNRDWHKNTSQRTQNRGRLSPVTKTAAKKPRET